MNPYILAALWAIGCGALIWTIVLHERIRMMRLERDFAIGDAEALAVAFRLWRDEAAYWQRQAEALEISVGLLDAELERVGRGGAA